MIKYALGLLLLTVAANGLAVPFWGAKQTSPADTPLDALQPGEFIWEGQIQTDGPVVIVVSLTEQRAYVYRNGLRIGVTTVSTGKRGHRTPTGVFTILNKDKNHRSSTYNNAPMPYSERLTWGGVALHAGGLPGYPSSHGCVHLPSEFARLLFGVTQKGINVVIANEATAPDDIVHPAIVAPVDAASGAPDRQSALPADESFRWRPPSTEGAISVIISGADRRAVVMQDGEEIGRARVDVDQPQRPLGTHAYTMLAGDAPTPRWQTVALPGYAEGIDAAPPGHSAVDRVRLPRPFYDRLRPKLKPGATLLITDAEVLVHTTGPTLSVLSSGLPDDAQ